MTTAEQIQLLALCRIEGLSWTLVAREARRPNGLDVLASGRVTERSKEAERSRQQLRGARNRLPALQAEVEETLRDATERGLRLTTVLDEDYPLNLRTIFNAPPFVFYRGNLDADTDARSVAVVGTRRASAQGLERARKMAKLLVESHVTVLSGLARGIDTAAHEATLDAGGRTIAVLGSGLSNIYPPENEALVERIVERGAVVSQFFPRASPTKISFPLRNVTMSGMGQGTVVIEAGPTSGAKLQARLALEHGRKVFLVSNLVAHQVWARKYIARGAVEVKDVESILHALRSPEQIRARAHDTHQLALGLD